MSIPPTTDFQPGHHGQVLKYGAWYQCRIERVRPTTYQVSFFTKTGKPKLLWVPKEDVR